MAAQLAYNLHLKSRRLNTVVFLCVAMYARRAGSKPRNGNKHLASLLKSLLSAWQLWRAIATFGGNTGGN